MDEERDRKACLALDLKVAGANRELAHLAKERTPQAGYGREGILGGRIRGSHRLPGGGDRVRLSRGRATSSRGSTPTLGDPLSESLTARVATVHQPRAKPLLAEVADARTSGASRAVSSVS